MYAMSDGQSSASPTANVVSESTASVQPQNEQVRSEVVDLLEQLATEDDSQRAKEIARTLAQKVDSLPGS
jgi:hypothetical protein